MALAFKLGLLPPRADATRFKLSTYLDSTKLPKIPSKFGFMENIVKNWQMLGNDQFGDCVFAGAGHETMGWTAEGGAGVQFTEDSCLSDYSAVTGFNRNDPDSDQGTDMEVAAKYRRKTGVVDGRGRRHKVAAYLDVKPGNINELKQAVYLFSAVGIGIKFPQSAMNQFNNHEPWSVVEGSPIEGGHYVPVVGFDGHDFVVVTWGALQRVTVGFVKKYMDQGLAYLSAEMLKAGKSPTGLNIKQLEADLKAL